MLQKTTIIINPISGNQRKREENIRLVHRFAARHRVHDIVETRKRGDAAEFSRAAVKGGQEMVVAVGGDGTINEVASELVDTDVCLGIVPLGSGNGLARSIYLPRNVEEACQILHDGRVAAIDVGKVNARYFFLIAGVGFDAHVGLSFENHSKRGPLAYFYLAAREFFSYRPEALTLDTGTGVIEEAPFVVAIANGRQYGNNALVAPGAKLDDGLLNVLVVHALPWWRLPVMLSRLFSGAVRRVPGTSFCKTNTVVIQRKKESWVNVDGEICLEAPELNISILPKSLRIMTPPNIPSLVA